MRRIRNENYNTLDAWNEIYKKERNEGKIRTNDPIWEPFVRYIPGNAKIIDVGCGTGGFLRYIKKYRPSAELTGLDHSEEAIFTAKEICPDNKFYYNFLDITEQFDVAVCSEVLEHITDNFAFIENIVNLVKDDGYIITTTPWRWSDVERLHVWDYESADDILELTQGKCMIIDYWINSHGSDLCVVMKKIKG